MITNKAWKKPQQVLYFKSLYKVIHDDDVKKNFDRVYNINQLLSSYYQK